MEEVKESELVVVRSLDVIGAEIEKIKEDTRAVIVACEAYTRNSCFEIGRLLREAKESVGHGEYLPWLETVGYSEPTASNLIRIYTEMGNDDVFSGLSYAQLRELLPLSRQERKELAPEIEDKSSREIKRLVKELELAKAEKAAAEADKDIAEQAQKDAEGLLDRRDKEIAGLKKERSDWFAAKTTAEAALKKAKKDMNDKLKQANGLLASAQEREEAATETIQALKKQIENGEPRPLTEKELAAIRKDVEKEVSAKQAKAEVLADPAMVKLNTYIEEVGLYFYRISELLENVKPEQSKELRQKVAQLFYQGLSENDLLLRDEGEGNDGTSSVRS